MVKRVVSQMRNWGVVEANELAKVTDGRWQKCAQILLEARGPGSCQSNCLTLPKVTHKVSNKLTEAGDTHLIKLLIWVCDFLIVKNQGMQSYNLCVHLKKEDAQLEIQL